MICFVNERQLFPKCFWARPYNCLKEIKVWILLLVVSIHVISSTTRVMSPYRFHLRWILWTISALQVVFISRVYCHHQPSNFQFPNSLFFNIYAQLIPILLFIDSIRREFRNISSSLSLRQQKHCRAQTWALYFHFLCWLCQAWAL